MTEKSCQEILPFCPCGSMVSSMTKASRLPGTIERLPWMQSRTSAPLGYSSAVLRASQREVCPPDLRARLEQGASEPEASPWMQRVGIALAAMLAWAILMPFGPESEETQHR